MDDLSFDRLGDAHLKDLRGSYAEEPGSRHHGRLPGDYYHEPDDVVRGTTVSSSSDFMCGGASGCPAPGDTDGAGAGAGFLGDAYGTAWTQDHLERGRPTPPAPFSDAAGPPVQLPCPAAVTSVALEDASPADVATFVHSFLTTTVCAVVTKVRPEKFAMKAEAFHDIANCPLSCTIKARVFRAQGRPCEKPGLVVEFQRRAGDAIAFHSVFSLARQSLLRRFASAETRQAGRKALAERPAERPAEDRAFLAGAMQAGAGDLQPLMDMLVGPSSTAQAEAVAALVAFASANAAGACAICTLLADLQGVVQTLLGSDHLKVSYPAARLVSTLAKRAGRSVAAPVLGCVAAVGPALDPAVRSELAWILAQ